MTVQLHPCKLILVKATALSNCPVSVEVYWNSHAAEGVFEPSHFRVSTAHFDTREEAEAAIANAPKGCKLRVTTCSHVGGKVTFFASTYGRLLSDGVNGGVNETGIKRLATCLRWAGDLAYVSELTARTRNSYKTVAEIRSALSI